MAITRRETRIVNGRRERVTVELTPEEESKFQSDRDAANAATPIPLEVFCQRIEAEGLWDSFSDVMNNTAARRRIWDQMCAIRRPIPADSATARNVLTAAGATAAQIARIMAV